MSHEPLLKDERGVSSTEYLILIVLVALAGWAAWTQFGQAVSEKIAPSSSVTVAGDPLV